MAVYPILLCVAGLPALYYAVPLAWKICLRVRLGRRALHSGKLALTFDDGPGNRLTPAILDLLRASDCKATFFLLGRNIAGREDLVRRIVAEGHEIGIHGYDHLNYRKVGPVRTLRDIQKARTAVADATGGLHGTRLFRPPYGRLNLACMVYLWMHRMSTMYWTFDMGDTWPVEKRDARRAEKVVDPPGGAVVLLHDFDRASVELDAMVIQSVTILLTRAKEMQMPLVTASAFLRGGGH